VWTFWPHGEKKNKMAGQIQDQRIPWFETMTKEQLEALYKEDPQGVTAYLSSKLDEYERVAAALRPREPIF
jgi:hypothetical protein